MTTAEAILIALLFVAALWIAKRESDIRVLRRIVVALRARQIPTLIQGAATGLIVATFLPRIAARFFRRE